MSARIPVTHAARFDLRFPCRKGEVHALTHALAPFPSLFIQAKQAGELPERRWITMMLLTQELRRMLPPLYAGENDPDPLVICKFFYPDFGWTWYGIEFDGEDLFIGLVDGDEQELGYFRLSELQENRGQLGLPIEREIEGCVQELL
jgi:hypothetical protein